MTIVCQISAYQTTLACRPMYQLGKEHLVVKETNLGTLSSLDGIHHQRRNSLKKATLRNEEEKLKSPGNQAKKHVGRPQQRVGGGNSWQ